MRPDNRENEMPELDCTTTYKKIEGHPGYMVGDDGSIWSAWKKVGRGKGGGTKQVIGHEWRRLNTSSCNSHKYQSVVLSPSGRKRYVHELVLTTFVGPCPEGMECRHFPDSNPRNNSLDNLRWGTSKENEADKLHHGTDIGGERNKFAKLNAKQVLEIRTEYDGKPGSYRRMADKFSVTDDTISNVINRKTWRRI